MFPPIVQINAPINMDFNNQTYLKYDNQPKTQPKEWQNYYPNSIWWETNLKYDKTITPIVYDGRPKKPQPKNPATTPPAGWG